MGYGVVPVESGLKRLYLDHPLGEGVTVRVEAGIERRLRSVLRFRGGEAIRVFNGAQGEWSARLGRGCRSLRISERILEQPSTPRGAAVLFCPVKAMEYLVIKATELGASAFHPLLSERTVIRRWNRSRMRAWIIGAAEQCGRLDLPEIGEPRRLDAFFLDWRKNAGGAVLYATPQGEPALDVCRRSSPLAACLIGPEGGFTPGEVASLGRFPFLKPCRLADHLLRSETAVAAALAIIGATRNPESCHG